jgi:hypothetical protein
MTPKSRNGPLLSNASLSTFPTQRVGCPGINTRSRDNGYAEYNRRIMLEVVISVRFALSYIK